MRIIFDIIKRMSVGVVFLSVITFGLAIKDNANAANNIIELIFKTHSTLNVVNNFAMYAIDFLLLLFAFWNLLSKITDNELEKFAWKSTAYEFKKWLPYVFGLKCFVTILVSVSNEKNILYNFVIDFSNPITDFIINLVMILLAINFIIKYKDKLMIRS